ncbi:hypothetical protein [Pseudooceanicola nanhaiensis]|uniref:hypothetical protein n=1 Tax=Pseudooceanicola nanhaiensis TaxID=375761 RepID=UPI004057F278
MTARKLQTGLALIFLILGAWCLIAPAMVVRFTFQPEFNEATRQARFLMGCFGAQAVLNGTILLTARFTPTTFLVFGLVGSVPFFAFNIWFWLVEPVLNAWMLLDLAGNVGILACGLWGWALARHEDGEITVLD